MTQTSIPSTLRLIDSIDPRTGEVVESVSPASSVDTVDRLVEAAVKAAPPYEALGRTFRSAMLRLMAERLELNREAIVAVADRETAIGEARLNGELTRTVYQTSLFADAIDEGSFLEATIDHAAQTPMGPGPDLRRILLPLGPVAVFGSSNFPLAFSVPGGDTISALAAGCPVILKAHTSHPATSRLCFDILQKAAQDAEAPEGLLGIVYGQAAGSALVANPGIKAVGFTGSLGGGKALMDVIAQRSEPIPFYGELSSLNPVVVTPAAATNRGQDIAGGIVDSITLSAGQLCTKPGVVFLPSGKDADAIVAAAAHLINDAEPRVLLNNRIRSSYESITQTLETSGVTLEGRSRGASDMQGFTVSPQIFSIEAENLTTEIAEECFGPTTVIVRYGSIDDLLQALAKLPSSLTGTLHHEDGDLSQFAMVLNHFRANAGRIIFNGYPTGVLVSWAQTHGGPWPATNSLHTSVGVTAIRRFLRPITYQNAASDILPEELRDGYDAIPRRVDGKVLPAI